MNEKSLIPFEVISIILLNKKTGNIILKYHYFYAYLPYFLCYFLEDFYFLYLGLLYNLYLILSVLFVLLCLSFEFVRYFELSFIFYYLD